MALDASSPSTTTYNQRIGKLVRYAKTKATGTRTIQINKLSNNIVSNIFPPARRVKYAQVLKELATLKIEQIIINLKASAYISSLVL